MSLVPKITVASIDTLFGLSITIQDTTGPYNAGTNPGGYGTPNYATTDLDWAILRFRNYENTDYTDQKLTDLTDILATGQKISGLVGGKFPDGVWELKYYPVIAHPVTPNVDTTITWTLGSKTFNLASASTILAGAKAILIKDISQTKLYFLDPAVPATSGQATVTEQLPSSTTGLLAITYEADTRFIVSVDADDCLAKDTGLALRACTNFDPRMQELYLRMGQKQGADLHFSKGNYQAAHNLILQLGSYCSNLSNCGCK